MPHAIRVSLFAAALTLAATVAHAADVPPAADAAKHDLRYKFTTGTVLRYKVDHRAAIRSTIDETTQEAQTKTESVKAWKVTDVLPSGELEFMSVVESVYMNNRLPDRAPVEYDSTKDATPPPGYEDTARAIGIPLSVVRMTPRGKITSHNVKHRQPAADKDAQIVIRLPDEPVAVGATWDEPFDVTVTVESGGTKSIQTRRHYELLSVENGIAKIEVTYQILSPIDAKIESQLVQKLMKGTVRFDIEAGRIDSQLFEVDKRVLGFAGPTSSMHYVMRMEEKLSDAQVAVAKRPAAKGPVARTPVAESLRESSLVKKRTTLTQPSSVTPETRDVPKVASKPQTTTTKSTTTNSTRRPTQQRRPPQRSASRNSYGKATNR
jgi:hypothetical protein